MSRTSPGRGVRPRDAADYFKAAVTRDNDLIEVFVDGRRVPSCVRARVSQGWATTYEIDLHGFVVRDGLGRPKEFYIRGVVELRRCND